MRLAAVFGCVALAMMAQETTQFTRGIGVYPGDPRESFAPGARPAAGYRNLALRRPAWHSSSYDYNLTAQLVTDGIKTTDLPRWVAVSTSQHGVLQKREREWVLDHNPISTVNLKGAQVWVQIEIGGGAAAPEIDRIDVIARPQGGKSWLCRVEGSADGAAWRTVGEAQGSGAPPRELKPAIDFNEPSRSRFYRVTFDAPGTTLWRIGEIAAFRAGRRVELAGPYSFTSAWMSAWAAEEWVYVDLGAGCKFDRIALSWIRRAAEAKLQASNDAKTWRDLEPELESDEWKGAGEGRYVRVLMTRPEHPAGYILSELEVWGRGGTALAPHAAAPVRPDGSLALAGGAWRVERASEVKQDGAELSVPGYKDDAWVVATVPGTILTSFYNAGAVPNPDFGDNQLMISDSYFYSDFWYRNEFVAPALQAGKRAWLHFDGINWKAGVWLNGEKLGRIEGGFMRARFDVTGKLKPGLRNALAVQVEKNATPGSVKEKTFENPDVNGGALGADNPTYHASIGWDWIPTIRGRNTGIWNDVRLTQSGAVTIEEPQVATKLPLPDTSRAAVAIDAVLRNHSTQTVSGVLKGRFGPLTFERPVEITAQSEGKTSTTLQLENPRLWWPAGYGDPSLYPVKLQFVVDGVVSDAKKFQAGVRQWAYREEGGALRMWINGRRFVPRGGNWGFPESMLRYRAREYDAAVRYHREMNFTMIRNWVGMTGDDEFYDACDKHGIAVWQDFWLANPVDGPNPDDNGLFLANVRDTLRRIRNHASIGLYCGRNEGSPPPALDAGIRQELAALHPGIHYIPDSAARVVSGHGPYRAQPLKSYFTTRATPKFHSEMGMPNIVTFDSLREFMTGADMWPQAGVWGLHDFCLGGAQGGASFRESIDKSYGGAASAAEWVTLAQFVNYEGYRAMYEAQSKNRMGLLIWMSHPAWPSFVWQTYDYYLEPTAAYFGAKKASEPLHIQWNAATDMVEVVNYSAGNASGLTASAEILNLDGARQWEKPAALDCAEDSVAAPIQLEFPATLTPVHFIRLKLMRAGELVSENFYWRGTEEYNYRVLRTLPKVKLEAATKAVRQGGRWLLTTELNNPSAQPALMVRLKAVREKTGDRILPAIYSDNYIALMPGERRTLRVEIEHADTRGERPRLVVEGFNTGGVTYR